MNAVCMRITATRCLVISATLSIGIGATAIPAEQGLVYIESHTDAVGSRPGVIATSRDGRHLYVARTNLPTILVYQRNIPTGRLKLIQSLHLDEMQTNPYWLALTPDGWHLYFPATENPAHILVVDRDDATGRLATPRLATSGATFPRFRVYANGGLLTSPDGTDVYSTSSALHTLRHYRRDAKTGALTPGQLFQDDDAGKLEPGFPPGSEVPRIDGAITIDGLKDARGIALSRDRRHVYVASSGDRAVAAFARHENSGELRHVETLRERSVPPTVLNRLGFPTEITIDSEDRFLYVASAGGDVAVLGRDTQSGRLNADQWLSDGKLGVSGIANARRVVISRDGLTVYVGAMGPPQGESCVTVFRRDPERGRLVHLREIGGEAHPEYGLTNLSWICLSPDGRHLYATSSTRSVIAFRVTSASGDD
jgi:6-phosphogluconolactonase (cycloisomerase 2 family)